MSPPSRDICPHLYGTPVHRLPTHFSYNQHARITRPFLTKERHWVARNNLAWIKGDITGDIYYDNFHLDSKDVQYLRLYLMIKGVVGAAAVKGVRVCVYGPLAELVIGQVLKGSRLGVIGHIQQRTTREGKMVFEIVAEEVEFLRNIEWEAGCDVGSKRILWMKVNPDFEILIRLMVGLRAEKGWRYWISEHVIEVNTCDMGEEIGHTATEVKIALPKSNNTLTSVDEYVQ